MNYWTVVYAKTDIKPANFNLISVDRGTLFRSRFYTLLTGFCASCSTLTVTISVFHHFSAFTIIKLVVASVPPTLAHVAPERHVGR